MWDIQNKICLITGATSGIGRQTALELADKGARVMITYRNEKKAADTGKYIRLKTGKAIETFYCDLSSFRSIRSFVNEFASKYKTPDVLINNAGIWEPKRNLSSDGIELSFAVNHLAPFLLTNLLLENMPDTIPSRIINVTSAAYKNYEIDFDDIELKHDFNGFKAYSLTKLANILFTLHLAEKLRPFGSTVNCVHPGLVATNIFNNAGVVLAGVAKMFMLSVAKGAETSVYLATSNEVSHITGKYFTKKQVENLPATTCNQELARKLWEISEQYVGLCASVIEY